PIGVGGPIRAASFDAPRPGASFEWDAILLDGWIVGRDEPVAAIEIVDGETTLARLPVERARPDVAADHPEAPDGEICGFRGIVPASGPAGSFRLTAAAAFAGGARVVLGEIAGERLDDAAEPPPADWRGPDFIIIGAQRGGTTGFHQALAQHPRVVPAATKELHFFDVLFDRGSGWYWRQFPAALPDDAITGEATPYYLFHPHAARRAAAVAPEARLIVLLRDPVERAWSHYHLSRSQGLEPLSFAEAVEREPERLAGEREQMLADERYYSFAHQHYAYLERGRYAEQLEEWFRHFPREQFLILASERFYADPAGSIRQAASFLGLPPFDLPRWRPMNESGKAAMDRTLRRELTAGFTADNERLARLLGWTPRWAE
ncbi:MAG TPA: sulfotransferase domain-containing protein, partial [Thermomicrobiales bacterium]|nr:sulfotransferase domain-containing protein [Thermomicrobiales bacterium]